MQTHLQAVSCLDFTVFPLCLQGKDVFGYVFPPITTFRENKKNTANLNDPLERPLYTYTYMLGRYRLLWKSCIFSCHQHELRGEINHKLSC